MRRAEDALQRGIVQYLRAILPADGFRVCAIPNGGRRSKIEAAIMKGLGVLAGMPDLLIFGAGGRCWFIECKSGTGRLSPAQQEMREWMELARVPRTTARTIDDVHAALHAWGIMTREAA